MILFLPKNLLSSNSLPDYGHLAMLMAGYSEVFVPFPSVTATDIQTKNDLAVTLSVLSSYGGEFWASVPWNVLLASKSSTAQLSYDASLEYLCNEMKAINKRLTEAGMIANLKGFHIPTLNCSTRFTGIDETIVGLDRAFFNELVEVAHGLSLRFAFDGEHPSEHLGLVQGPSERTTQELEGLALTPTLLGSDSSQLDVVILRNPLTSGECYNGLVTSSPGIVNGTRLGEYMGLARRLTTGNYQFWAYQDVDLSNVPSDLKGGSFLSAYEKNVLSGTASLLRACGFTNSGVGAFEKSGSRRVLPVESVQIIDSSYINTRAAAATVTSANGKWSINFTGSDGTVFKGLWTPLNTVLEG